MFNKRDTILSRYSPSTQTVERIPLSGTPANDQASTQETSPAEKSDTPAASTAPASNETGSRLVVGPNVKLKGAEIENCDVLVVEGRVEATMNSRVLRVANNGAFSGKVGIEVAEIHGRFDGDLTARGQLIIHASGRVSGTIRYGKLLVEEGGELSGDIRALSSEDDASVEKFGKHRDSAGSNGVRPTAQ
jgi:cytoskeletal protein CcmA (bactofilin family)